MRESSTTWSVRLCALAIAALASGACNQSSSGPLNDNDAAASGGTSGVGGASPTGGSATSGGAPGSGGASSAGGSSGSGGTQAMGGTVSTGGASNPGGTTSAGGARNTGGAAGTGGRTRTGGTTGAGGTTGQGGNDDAGASPEDGAMPPADAPPGDAGGEPRDAPASDRAPQACPSSQPAPSAGDRTVTLQHGGRSRKYILHVPSGLAAGTALAVVFDLHGAGGNGSQQKGMSGFGAVADREKFLVVYPDGIDGYWNVDDTCCGTAGKEKIDDVGFLRAIIEKLGAEICIDGKRIYVSGFSNGGGLAHRMGCDAADVIAAIAPTGTDLRTQPCNAVRPISMMEVRGMADSLEPYEGGMVGPPGGQYLAVGAKASLKLWADINQCTGTPTTMEKYCESYTECEDGVETDLCSLPNVDHSPYSNSLGFNVASVAWSMFKRQPMK